MSIFIKELVKNKLKTVNPNELLHLSKTYGFHLTNQQANEIAEFLHANTLDPFNQQDREEMFRELARITSMTTAQRARKLLYELAKSNGLEYLLE